VAEDEKLQAGRQHMKAMLAAAKVGNDGIDGMLKKQDAAEEQFGDANIDTNRDKPNELPNEVSTRERERGHLGLIHWRWWKGPATGRCRFTEYRTGGARGAGSRGGDQGAGGEGEEGAEEGAHGV
jgi:hypothetical protein